MNRIIEYFARQGIFANIITLFVIVAGVFAVLSIRRETFPNINFDVITVVTSYPGASPESSERLITNPLEQDIKEVNGIKRMTSISREGGSTIILQLDPNQTTAQKAKEEVTAVIDRIQDLPDGAEDPIVTIAESKLTPVIEIGLGGPVDESELRATAKFLERQIESLPEVAKVQFNGLRDYEVRVEAHPDKLRMYRVSLQEIIQALAARNISVPGGTIEAAAQNNYQEMIVRTVGEFETAEDVAQTVVRANALGEPIKLKDVATVNQVFEKETRGYRINGTRALSVTVLKKEKADVLNLVDNVKTMMEKLKPQINPKIQISYLNDSSFYVRRRISVLSGNLMLGLVLVVIVLSVMLPWRIALMTAIGIPFSFLGTITIFYLFDISINLISMMGLIIVSGMLVDDAVVVTENCQRYREKGMSTMDAAIKGAQQIWAPVTVSVLTTVMAFAPMLYMTGIFGKFIQFIPLGVIIALLISLWEVIFILPHHFVAWAPADETTSTKRGVFNRLWEGFAVPAYQTIVVGIAKWRWGVLVLALALLGFSAKFAKDNLDFVLFPPGGVEVFVITFDAPNGSALAYTTRIAQPIEDQLQKYKAETKGIMDDFTIKFGIQQTNPNDPASKVGSEYGQAFVYLTPTTERLISAKEVIEELRNRIGKPEGIMRISFEQLAGGPPVGRPVSIGVRGSEYPEIMKVVEKISKELEAVAGVSDIQNNYLLGKKEIQISIRDGEASAAGLQVRDIGTAVRASFEGIVPTTIRKLDEEVDIRVTLTQSNRTNVRTLDQIEVSNSRGQLIPLDRVTQSRATQSMSVFQHENNLRQVSVTSEIDTSTTNAREVNALMKTKLDKILKDHPLVTAHFGGESEDTQESLISLGKAFAFAVFGIFLIMVLLFQNIYQPLIVASTIPMGVVAVIWTFYLHGKPLSFLAMIGVIALAGVIVNNAIVMVDFVNQLRQEGYGPIEAVVQSAVTRLRPIFLTTFTTVAGLLPTAYGIGGLDPFVVPIALALGWGLGIGAFLTIVILPALILIADDCVRIMGRVLKVKRKPLASQ